MNPVELVLCKLPNAKRNGQGWMARCPAHDDRNPSLSIATGDDGCVLLKCHAGCTTDEICSALQLTTRDLFVSSSSSPAKTTLEKARQKSSKRIYATPNAAACDLETQTKGSLAGQWPYHDGTGKEVFQVLRFQQPNGQKTYRPIHPVGNGWVMGAPPGLLPLYRLHELQGIQRVYITEGEKAADAARDLGLTATTSAHGANSAGKTNWQPLAGKEIIILPDNDDAGRKYAEAVAAILGRLTPAPLVKIVELPGLPDHGDIVEYIEANEDTPASVLHDEIEALADQAEAIIPVDDEPDTGQAMPVLVTLADVQPEPIDWLWDGRFALGKLTLISGDPGLGKSFLTMDMAARVSTGTPWPDSPLAAYPCGDVVLLNAEDDLASTIRPRLDAAKADVNRITAIDAIRRPDPVTGNMAEEPFCLTTDLAALETAINNCRDCRLAIIDPITAYLGNTDSHKNADIRRVLAPLAKLAEHYHIALIAVTHLNKSASGPAIYRSMGSLAFTAAARAVWGIVKDKDNPQRRLMLPIKNNIAADMLGMAYTIGGEAAKACVVWEPEPIRMSADDAMAAVQDEDCNSEREQAKEWIRTALSLNSMSSKQIIAEANENGIATKTLRRAYQDMGGKPTKSGFDGGWRWTLPTEDGHTPPQDSQDAHLSDVGNFGTGGHLREDDRPDLMGDAG